jgi:hypothetical protein
MIFAHERLLSYWLSPISVPVIVTSTAAVIAIGRRAWEELRNARNLLSQHIRGRRIPHRFCNQGWSSCNEHVRNVAEPRGPDHHATPPKLLVLPDGAFTMKIGLLATKRLKALRPRITLNTETNEIGKRKETI